MKVKIKVQLVCWALALALMITQQFLRPDPLGGAQWHAGIACVVGACFGFAGATNLFKKED